MTKSDALLEGVEVMHRAFGSEISAAVLRLYSEFSGFGNLKKNQ
jgi:hypothetical protein